MTALTGAELTKDPPAGGSPVEATRRRLQRLVAVLLVGVLPWLIAPGRVQPDTKSDLVLSPGRYLERALWAWNDHTGIGELQNQAYGYLWPMGSFFLAGDAVGMPAWAVQRLWWTLLLVIAFVGAERLARRVGGLPTVPALVTGVVFALSPRVLTVLAEISVEVWPYALAPWLVLAAHRAVVLGAGSAQRRHATLVTGLLTACLGGVNATVSLVALTPAAAWLLLAPTGRARWRALTLWFLGAGLGAAWWLGPLLVLGGFSYPFLDHIELASTTTAVASVTNVLRGAEHWIAYILTAGQHPTWQSGWLLAQAVPAIVATTALAGLGLAGLVRRRGESAALPGEAGHGRADEEEGRHLTRWALMLVLLGVLVMAIGRSGSASGPLAEVVRAWLDGPLAPFRNVHKADLLVRLPVALGVGLLAHWATRMARGAGPLVRQVVVTATVLALVGALTPIWVGRVGDAWAPEEIPSGWRTAAREVDAAAARDGGTTLVLPGARSADFTWGRVTDEPLRALAASPVLVRAAAPLGHPAATRILDHLDELTSSGHTQVHLAEGLRRLGISRVVVRGGVSPDVGAVDPQKVAATFAASPGLTCTWSEGVGSEQISLWRVDEPAAPGSVVPRGGVVPVAAAPEGWFALVASGLLDPATVTTLAGGAEARVRTDTLRWQARNSGRPPAQGRGPTLPRSNPLPGLVGTRDLDPGGGKRARTTRFYDGLDGIRVSSSAADPFAPQWRGAGEGPSSIVDGDARSAWVSGDGAAHQRVTLELSESARPRAVLVHEAWGGDLARLASVSVDGRAGTRAPGTMTWRVPLEGSAREEVALDLRRSDAGGTAPVGIREVQLEDGPALGTGLRLPRGKGPVLITRDPRAAANPSAGEDPDDLVREVGPLPSTYVATTVRIRPGQESQGLAAAPWSLVGSTAPTQTGDDLTHWPIAALDGDPETSWTPPPGVAEPTLDIDLGARRRVERIRLDRAVGPVTVATDTGRYALASGTDLRIPAQTTSHLTLIFTRPPGRAEWSGPQVDLPGVPGPGARVELACGAAGAVGRRDGRIGLSVDVERARLIAGEPVPAAACGDLPAGDGSIRAVAVPGLVPQTITLTPRSWHPTEVAEGRGVTSHREHSGRWTFDVDGGAESLLVMTQGANPGWQAMHEDGTPLESLTVDGWRQAFVLPAGKAISVRVDFAPNTDHRRALALGAGAVVVLGLWGLLELAAGRRRSHPTERARDGSLLEDPVEPPAREAADERDAEGADERALGPVPLLLAVLVAAVIGLLVGGWVGLSAAALGALVPARGRAVLVALVLVGAGVALAVLGVAERASTGAWVAQGLGSLTLGTLAAALVRPGAGAPRRAPDAPGASTTGAPDPR